MSYQSGYFKGYAMLPGIIAIATLIIFFIWGIVDPIVFKHSYYYNYYSSDYTYGVMGLSNGFLCWLVWMVIGAVTALIEYIFGKMHLSQKILTVLYLQKLCGENTEQASDEEMVGEHEEVANKNEVLPTEDIEDNE